MIVAAINYDSTKEMKITRSIASDCQTLVHGILNSKTQSSSTPPKALTLNESLKMRNSIWNRILYAHEFHNFNDFEYFKWKEIYLDHSTDLSKLNPTTIEQKLALIETLNMRYIHGQNQSIMRDIENLDLRRLKKLEKHLVKFDLSSKVYNENMESFVLDFMLILKGSPLEVNNYFSTSKELRISKRLMRMVQEDVLMMGLAGIAKRVPAKDSYAMIEKAKILANKIFKYKILRLWALPYDLPWFDKVKIPEELLSKILIDGLDVHEKELIAHFKKQNMIDHYEKFRTYYRPVAMTFGVYVYYNIITNKIIPFLTGNDDKKDQITEEIKILKESLDATPHDL